MTVIVVNDGLSIKSLVNYYYKITQEIASDKSLEIINCNPFAGDRLPVWSTINTPCQEWYMADISGSSFWVMNKLFVNL